MAIATVVRLVVESCQKIISNYHGFLADIELSLVT